MKTNYFLVLAILFITFGSAQSYSIDHIPSEIQNNAKAVIRSHQTHVILKSYDVLQVEYELVISVFGKEGDAYAILPMHYNNFSRIKDYGGELFDAKGKSIKKFRKRDYKDFSAVSNGTLYADYRVKHVDFTPTQYPYTIHQKVIFETNNTAFIPGWDPIQFYNVGIEQIAYTFENESNLPIANKELNFSNNFQVEKQILSNGFKYTLDSIRPILHEVLSPSLEEFGPKVMMSSNKFQLAGFDGEYTDWNDFGKWMYDDLIRGRQEIPAQEKAKVHALIAGVESDQEKVRILYQYMQEKTRYINVAIGIGGWQPYPAMDVSEKSYGDCKALSNYMMSILNEANISSNYTVVYGDRNFKRDIRPDFPSLQGNHVILQVPLENDTIWLECTSQLTAFNHLGEFTSDRYALAINEEGGKIVKTQTFPIEKNQEIIVGKAKINTNGQLDLTFQSVASGIQYDWNYPVYYRTKTDQSNWLESKLSDIQTKNIENFEFINDRETAKFTQNVYLTSESYSQISNSNLIFPLIPINRHKTSLSKDSNRIFPIQINVGYQDLSEFEFEIPENYNLNYDIEPIYIESDFGFYSLNYNLKDQTLRVERELQIFEGVFPKEDFLEYVDFRRAIERADNTKILLEL